MFTWRGFFERRGTAPHLCSLLFVHLLPHFDVHNTWDLATDPHICINTTGQALVLSVSISAPKYNYPFNLPTQISNAQTNRHSNTRINLDIHPLRITDIVWDVLGEFCCVSLEIQA